MRDEEGFIVGDRRASVRKEVSEGSLQLTILVRPGMRKYQVSAADISNFGIGFLMDESLPLGSVLAVQQHVLIPGRSWIRSGKVIHATPRGDRWLIGCEVSPPFSKQELEVLQNPEELGLGLPTGRT